MRKHLSIISAVILGFFVLGSIPVWAAGGGDALMPKEISKEEAAKKYPLQQGKTRYPEGIATSTSTGMFYQSPYSSRIYDCRKLKHGVLVLDESVNKLFRTP